jgi:hypothetical protein
VIDWLIHSRKHRWDVIFVIQNIGMLDKQVRDALLEYHVTCKRLDKLRIPVIGIIGKWLSLGSWNGCVGRLHLGVVAYAAGSQILSGALIVERWCYRGTDLFKAYDTEQVFSSRYDSGSFSYLPPWMQVGRYLEPAGWEAFKRRVLVQLGLRVAARRKLLPAPKLKPLLRLPAPLRWQAARRLVLQGLL